MSLTTADRLAIHELLALHGHLVDGGRLDRLGEVFVPDVRYDTAALGGAVIVGIDELVAAAEGLGARNPLAHLVTNTVITERTDGSIVATSKYLGLTTEGAVGSGTYFDTVVPTSEGWRVAARRVVPRRAPLQP